MPAKNKQSFFKSFRKYLSYIVFVLNLGAIYLMYLATEAWYVKGSEYPITASLGMFFPIIFAVNILFALLWLFSLKWKFLIVQVLAFIVLWNPISTYYPLHLKSDVPDDAIKVMSYNVRGFNWLTGKKARENPIFDYIVAQDADIICFQEFAISGNNSTKGLISEKEFNAIMKDYPHRAIIQLGNLKARHIYGIACYSKFPILESTRLQYPLSSYNGTVVHRLEVNEKKLNLVNNHLESNKITAADKELYHQFFDTKDKETLNRVAHNIHSKLGVAFEAREKQISIAKEYLEEKSADATILCGDFNDTPLSYTYYNMKGDLIDAYAKTGFGPGITYNENMFLFRIDYIFHTDNIESYNCKVDSKVKYSDHYPISTYLRFK